ncbi:F-box protein At3g56470-like [Lotus japonicus]|uniref:F-box protein At3g56470-like n=1 Tax=Lotus japonicus TaxID=34305 RepID=UPI0025848C54|nr:F-box protein At3g56470-like [Lotus japonicus]
MRPFLLEAIVRRSVAKRMKIRNRKRKLKRGYAGGSSTPYFLLEAIKRRFIAKRRKTRYGRKRELENKYYVDWSSLPQGVLEMVAEKLSFIDCLSFSKVCRSWNSVLGEELPNWQSQRHGFPWLLVSGQQNQEVRTCISIMENRIWELELPEVKGKYCWGSFRDWLILVKNLDTFQLEVNLLNPFSRSEVSLPTMWNFYHKMVLSGLPSENNFICMVLHSQHRELAFWIPGAQSWRKHKLKGEPFEDAVLCNGSFYLLGDGFNIWQIDVKSIYSSISQGDSEIEMQFHEVKGPEIQFQEGMLVQGDDNSRFLKYLVEFSGKLLLVHRYFSNKPGVVLETRKFEVYSLDYCQPSWKKVEDLGDQMIFLGKCSSASFSAKELGVGISNSIYFCNDQTAPWWNEWDSDHFKGISLRLGLNKTDGGHWGNFRLYNMDGEPFFYHGDIHSWAYTWLTAPSWWCYRNVPVISTR